jgi:hypothetical protein
MPQLDALVSLIDTSFQTGNFDARRFQIAKYYGIAYRVKTKSQDQEKIEPMTVDNSGNGVPVVYSDKWNLQVYHTIEDIDYKQAEPNYGPPGMTMEENASMRIVFIGNRRKLQVRPEDIAAAMIIDIPKQFLSPVVTPLGMSSVVITTGDVETDPYKVWAELYEGVNSFINPEIMMISIKYNIISTYNKGCSTLCSIEGEPTNE